MLGVKDVDLKILQELNDIELGKVCSTNKAINNICKDESFWMNRTLNKFSAVLGNIEKIREYKEKSNLTWRNYYISLVNFIDTVYSINSFEEQQFLKNISDISVDKKILYDFIEERTLNIANCIERAFEEEKDYTAFCGTGWMDDPFVDLTRVFDRSVYDFLDTREEIFTMLNQLLDKYNFKISDDVIVIALRYFIGEEAIQLILRKRNLTHITVKNLGYVAYETRKDLNRLLKYMTKENILHSLFSYIHSFGNFTDIWSILKTAKKKGATTTDIIRGMMLIPTNKHISLYSDIIDEVRRFLKDNVDGDLTENEKELLKEVLIKKVADMSTSRNMDYYFDIFKAI